MDLATTIGFALGWTNSSTRSEIQKQADRIIEAQAEEIRKLREPGGHSASVWREPKTTTFPHADALTAGSPDRGTLAALFFLVTFFFPPLGIVGLIFVYLREFLWLVTIGCIAVVFLEPLGPVQIAVALLIAGTCLACLLGEKISGSRNPAKRKRKKKLPKDLVARRVAFVSAVLLVPAYLCAAILWRLR